MIKVCKICGKEFESNYKRQTVCKDQHLGICIVCGTKFKLNYPYTTKTCSRICTDKYKKDSGISKRVSVKARQTMLEKYGVEHALQSEQFLNKSRSTLWKNYGVENPMHSEEIRRSLAETNFEKYGVDYPAKSEEVKCRMKETFLKNYGVENPMQDPDVKRRQQDSLEVSYGVRVPLKSDKIKSKMMQTNLLRYGHKCVFQVSSIQRKIKSDYKSRTGYEYVSQNPEVMAKVKSTCQSRYGVDFNCMRRECRSSYRTISKINKRFSELLSDQDIGFEMEFSLENYSYDFHILGTNILIEINPTITHNSHLNIWDRTSHGLDKYYHQNKSKLADFKGFLCLHMFDWDDVDAIITNLKISSPVSKGYYEPRLHWYNLKSKSHQEDIKDFDNMVSKGYLPVYDAGQDIIWICR